MSEEEKQIHLYMHFKNELGLATLCVEKDKEMEILQYDLDNANSKLKDYVRRIIRAIDFIENMVSKFDNFNALEVKTIKYILEGQGVDNNERNKNKAKSNKRTRRNRWNS